MFNKIADLQNEIGKLRDHISREKGKRDKVLDQLQAHKELISDFENNIELLDKVIILFQKTSEFAREQAKSQIESLVTKCLQYIFDTDLEFIIEIEELRSKASAEFYVVTETEDLVIKTKPEISRGGGIVDIVSLALRIAFLQIHKPNIEGPLILDEPAKHVSEDYIYNVGDFLKQTSRMFNRQIIMITHNQHLAALGDKGYRVDLSGTTSIVREMDI